MLLLDPFDVKLCCRFLVLALLALVARSRDSLNYQYMLNNLHTFRMMHLE
jgi:hypothetical protein